MAADPHINFGYSSVATAPSPATSGLSLVVQTGDGAKFPSSGAFNVTVWATGAQPTTANSEIVRVASRSGDTLTLAARAQETSFGGPAARTIVVGDQIALTVTAKTLQDIEATTFPVVQTTTATGTQNDFALTADCDLLRCNNATLLTLTGLAAGYDGQRLTVAAIGAGQVDLSHQDTGSTTAADRMILFATSGKTSLAPGGNAELVYDATTARWRLITHKQGAWIDVPYASGNFTASSLMTWTVDSGDQITYAYLLEGKTLKVVAYLDTTTIGGTLHTSLFIAIPAGFTAAKKVQSAAVAFDNGIGTATFNRVVVSGTTVETGRADSANWAASTNNTFVRVNIDVLVN
jgi:hypothetical protein